MQFQVPQFIEVEDKIFGPLTFKQFIYIGGGAGACYILWRVLPFFISVPLIVVVGGLAAGLAFFQFNGRPLITALESAFFFTIHGKLYLWNNARHQVKASKAAAPSMKAAPLYVPKLSENRLHELAWSLDIKERIAAGVADEDERASVRGGRPLAAVETAQSAMLRGRRALTR